jgi:quercetin dioxygenase-like cupin family protein
MKQTSLATLPFEPVSHNPQIVKQVMLRSGELPHLTNFSQARFAPGQIAPAHAHGDMCEVFWVKAGSGEIQVDQRLIPLVEGVCVVVEPGEQHEVRNTGTDDLILIYFGLRVESAV